MQYSYHAAAASFVVVTVREFESLAHMKQEDEGASASS
jgi:hypothetical protein